jgi:hypothetical protein
MFDSIQSQEEEENSLVTSMNGEGGGNPGIVFKRISNAPQAPMVS